MAGGKRRSNGFPRFCPTYPVRSDGTSSARLPGVELAAHVSADLGHVVFREAALGDRVDRAGPAPLALGDIFLRVVDKKYITKSPASSRHEVLDERRLDVVPFNE